MNKEELQTNAKPKSLDRKEFMKQVGVGFGAVMLMNCMSSCAESEIPDPLQPGTSTGDKVDFELDISNSDNATLQAAGGFRVISNERVIVARTLDNQWLAVSSACTHQGTTLQYRKDQGDFWCNNHNSEFAEDGTVEKGPATSNLKKFNTSFSETSQTLRIFE